MGISGSAQMMDGSIDMMRPCSAGMSRIQQINQIGSTSPPGTASWHWCGDSMRQPLQKPTVASVNSPCGMRSWNPGMSRPMLSLVVAIFLLSVGCLSAHAATFG
jgi:hypothetical protein